MNISDIISGLREHLDPKLQEQGFRFRKSEADYVKRANGFVYIFNLGVHRKTGWFLVTPGARIGHSGLAKIYKSILGRDASTICGFGVGNECNHKRGRYQIDALTQVEQAAQSMWADFSEVVEPFFASINTVKDLDHYLNELRRNRCGNSASGACLALVTAWQAKNPNLEDLKNSYYEFWSKANSPMRDQIESTYEGLINGS